MRQESSLNFQQGFTMVGGIRNNSLEVACIFELPEGAYEVFGLAIG